MTNDVWTRYARCAEFLVWRVTALPPALLTLGLLGLGLSGFWQLLDEVRAFPAPAAPWRPLFHLVLSVAALAVARNGWRAACEVVDGRRVP